MQAHVRKVPYERKKEDEAPKGVKEVNLLGFSASVHTATTY
jgi:hypothetical protein